MPERIGLALSGGGFRATLFHLGVIRFLRESDLLKRVDFIGGVSGGAILAMHAGLNWDRYTGDESAFAAVTKEIVSFCQSDVRNRILRRWIFGWLTLAPHLCGGWSRTHLLIREYQRLYSKATLDHLHPRHAARPRIIVQAVSLTTGRPCSFGRSGFMYYSPDDEDNLKENEKSTISPHLLAAFAVAASSAFPPMFPPLRVTPDLLHVPRSQFQTDEYVTDGGVYDNLGIERPLWHYEQTGELDAFVISDAGGTFSWDMGSFRFTLPRNIRATDILTKRVGELVRQRLRDRNQHQFMSVEIASKSTSLAEAELPWAVQNLVSGIRTDLDAFTDLEAHTLVRHGYAVAREQAILFGWAPPNPPSSAWSPVIIPGPIDANDWVTELKQSSRRSISPLVVSTDWPLWVAGVVWLVILLGAARLLS